VALVTAGRMFAEDAAAFAGAFIAQGMPRTFIADLNSLIEEFAQAIQGRDAGKEAHAAARINISAALASGTLAARKLDAMVANHLADNPLAVQLWRRERKVGHPRRTRPAGKATPVAAPAAPTAPASEPPAPASPGTEPTAATTDTKVA